MPFGGRSGSQWGCRIPSISRIFKRLDQRHAGMEPPPFSGVRHPVDIEPVRTYAVDASKWRIELLAAILLHVRPVALDEAILPLG
jgi:hypothetical protein